MQRMIWPTVTMYLLALAAMSCDSERSASSAFRPSTGPSSSLLNGPPAGPVAPFAVSGVVTEYRGGPLADVAVTARPNYPPGNGTRTTHTDANGFYRFDGLTEAIIIEASKESYWPTGFGAFIGDRVLDLTMSRELNVSAGQILTATIWGDSEISGEDWTGSGCDVHDSKGIHSNGCLLIPVATSGPGTLTARLSWNAGAGTEMGVFISTGFFAGQGAHGRSPLGVSAAVGGDTLLVVSFERAAGVRPVPPHASQAFTLETTFVPR